DGDVNKKLYGGTVSVAITLSSSNNSTRSMPVDGVGVAVKTRVEPAGMLVEPAIVRLTEIAEAVEVTVIATGFELLVPPTESTAVAVRTFNPEFVGVHTTLNGDEGP